MEIEVTRSTRELSFSLYPTGWWYEFLLQLSNRAAVRYELDTGQILLTQAGLGRGELEQRVAQVRTLLTPRGFADSKHDLSDLFSFLPNGRYSLQVETIGDPVLLRERSLSGSRLDHEGSVIDTELNTVREAMARPSLLIPTQALSTCDADTVELHRLNIQDGEPDERPLMLLLKEPHDYPDVDEKYHPDNPRYISTQQTPPDFGFNGNHLFFCGNNYFILDGHHKALAYEHQDHPPQALVIDCLQLDEASFPSGSSSAYSRPPDLDTEQYRLTSVTQTELARIVTAEGASPIKIAKTAVSGQLLQKPDILAHLSLQEKLSADRCDTAWRTRAIIEKGDDTCIGFVSLFGFPDRDGQAEFSLVVPNEAAESLDKVISALLTWVFSYPQSKSVVTTLGDNQHALLDAVTRIGMVPRGNSPAGSLTWVIERAWFASS